MKQPAKDNITNIQLPLGSPPKRYLHLKKLTDHMNNAIMYDNNVASLQIKAPILINQERCNMNFNT